MFTANPPGVSSRIDQLSLPDKSRLLADYCPDGGHYGQWSLKDEFADQKVIDAIAVGSACLNPKLKSLTKEILAAVPPESEPIPSDNVTGPLMDLVIQGFAKEAEPSTEVLLLLENLRASTKFVDPSNRQCSSAIRNKIKKFISAGLVTAERFKSNPKITVPIYRCCFHLSSIVGKMSLYLEVLVKAAEAGLLDEQHVPDFSQIAINRTGRLKISTSKRVTGTIQKVDQLTNSLPAANFHHNNTQVYFDQYRACLEASDYFTVLHRYPSPFNPEKEEKENSWTPIFQYRSNSVKYFYAVGNIWATQYSDMGVLSLRNKGYSRQWNFNYHKSEGMMVNVLDAKLNLIRNDFSNCAACLWCGSEDEIIYKIAFYKSSKTDKKVITIVKYKLGHERYGYQEPISEICIKSNDNIYYGWPEIEANQHRVCILNGMLVIIGNNKDYLIIEPESGILISQGTLSQRIHGIDTLRSEAVEADGVRLIYSQIEFFYKYSYFQKTLLENSSSSTGVTNDKSQLNFIEILGLKQGDESFEESDYESEEATKPTSKENKEDQMVEKKVESAAPGTEPTPTVEEVKKLTPTPSTQPTAPTPVKNLSKESGMVVAAYLDVLSSLAFESREIHSVEGMKPEEKEDFLSNFNGPEPIPATFNNLLALLDYATTHFTTHVYYNSILLSLLYLLKVHLDRVDLVQEKKSSGVRLVQTQTLVKIANILTKLRPPTPQINFEPLKRTVLEPRELAWCRGYVLAKLYLIGADEANANGGLLDELVSCNVMFPRDLLKRVAFEVINRDREPDTQQSVKVLLEKLKVTANLEKDVIANHYTFENKQRPTHLELKCLTENLRPILCLWGESKYALLNRSHDIVKQVSDIFDTTFEGFKLASAQFRFNGQFSGDFRYDLYPVWLSSLCVQLYRVLIKTNISLEADMKFVSLMTQIPDILSTDPLKPFELDNEIHSHNVKLSAQQRLFCWRVKLNVPEGEYRIKSMGPITAHYFRDSPNSLVVWGYLHDSRTQSVACQLYVYSVQKSFQKWDRMGLSGYIRQRRMELTDKLLEMMRPLQQYQSLLDEWTLLGKMGVTFSNKDWLDVDRDSEIIWDKLHSLIPKPAVEPVKEEVVPPTAGEVPVAVETEAATEVLPDAEKKAEEPVKEPEVEPAPTKDFESALTMLLQLLKLELNETQRTELAKVLSLHCESDRWEWLYLWSNLSAATSPAEQTSLFVNLKRLAVLYTPAALTTHFRRQLEAVEDLSEPIRLFVEMTTTFKESHSNSSWLLAQVLTPHSEMVRFLTSGKLLLAADKLQEVDGPLQKMVTEFGVYVLTKPQSDNNYDAHNRFLQQCLSGLSSLSKVLGENIKFDVGKLVVLQQRLKDMGDSCEELLGPIAARSKSGWQCICDMLKKDKPEDVLEDPEDLVWEVEKLKPSAEIPPFVLTYLNGLTKSQLSLASVSTLIDTPDEAELWDNNVIPGCPERPKDGEAYQELLEPMVRLLSHESKENVAEMVNSKHFPLARLLEIFLYPAMPPKVMLLVLQILQLSSPHFNREDSRVARSLKEALDLLSGALERYFTCIPSRLYSIKRPCSPSPAIFIIILKAYSNLKSPHSAWVFELKPSFFESKNPLPELAKLLNIIQDLKDPQISSEVRKSLLAQAENLLQESIRPDSLEFAPKYHKISDEQELIADKAVKLALRDGKAPSGIRESLKKKVYSNRTLLPVANPSSKPQETDSDMIIRLKRQILTEALTDFSSEEEYAGRKIVNLTKGESSAKVDLSAWPYWIAVSPSEETRLQTSTFPNCSEVHISVSPSSLVKSSSIWPQITGNFATKGKYECKISTLEVKNLESGTVILIPDSSRMDEATLSRIFEVVSTKSPKCSASRLQKLSDYYLQLCKCTPADKLPRAKHQDKLTLARVLCLPETLGCYATAMSSLERAENGQSAPRTKLANPLELPELECRAAQPDKHFLFDLLRSLSNGYTYEAETLGKHSLWVFRALAKATSRILVEPHKGGYQMRLVNYCEPFNSEDILALRCIGAFIGQSYLAQPVKSQVKIPNEVFQHILGVSLRSQPFVVQSGFFEVGIESKDISDSISYPSIPTLSENLDAEISYSVLKTLFRKKQLDSLLKSLNQISESFENVIGGKLMAAETTQTLSQAIGSELDVGALHLGVLPIIKAQLQILLSEESQTGVSSHASSYQNPNTSIGAANQAKVNNQPAAPPAAQNPPPQEQEEEQISWGGLFD